MEEITNTRDHTLSPAWMLLVWRGGSFICTETCHDNVTEPNLTPVCANRRLLAKLSSGDVIAQELMCHAWLTALYNRAISHLTAIEKRRILEEHKKKMPRSIGFLRARHIHSFDKSLQWRSDSSHVQAIKSGKIVQAATQTDGHITTKCSPKMTGQKSVGWDTWTGRSSKRTGYPTRFTDVRFVTGVSLFSLKQQKSAEYIW